MTKRTRRGADKGSLASQPGCSTISFRTRPLPDALATIVRAGFGEVDLGALPGVCDHVPIPLSVKQSAEVQKVVSDSPLRVRTINADPGDFNGPAADSATRWEVVRALCHLGTELGAAALILPCGRLRHEPAVSLTADIEQVAVGLAQAAEEAGAAGMRLLVEAPHIARLCHDVERTSQLLTRVPQEVAGLVLDVSHVQAGGGDPVKFVHEFGDRIEHIHLRDALPGNINLSVGRGEVDFAVVLDALAEEGYAGTMSLELETHDIAEDEREPAALAARKYISNLLREAARA